MTHTATEQTLLGNDNSAHRVIVDALQDYFHNDCELGGCTCEPRSVWSAAAREVLDQLTEDFRIVPKVDYDENAAVRPRVRHGWIYCDARDADPASARLYAAQLLAAADKAEEES